MNRPAAGYIAVANDDGKGEHWEPYWGTRVQQRLYDKEG